MVDEALRQGAAQRLGLGGGSNEIAPHSLTGLYIGDESAESQVVAC